MPRDGGRSDTIGPHDWTPLHAAAARGTVETVRALPAAGANLEPRDQDGRTPLQLAKAEGVTETVNALLVAGANSEASQTVGD